MELAILYSNAKIIQYLEIPKHIKKFLSKKGRKRFLIEHSQPKRNKSVANITFFLPISFAVSFFYVPLHHLKAKSMEITEQTIQQIERFIRKVAQKFPTPESEEETSVLTDIHVRVTQDSGELLAFDDDDNEITRCVVEQWINNTDENFYDEIAKSLRDLLRKNASMVDAMGILKPYSFVLEDDDKENLGELYLADDDTIIVGGDLMEGLDHDLDDFLNDLLKD